MLTRAIAVSQPRSLADALALAGGRPSGFDYLRLGLAFAIFLIHCFEVPYPEAVTRGWMLSTWHPVFAMAVPMFFALSGFLVAGSLQRCATLVSFLGLRGLRIFPALTVEVVLSALVLGPLVTTMPVRDYFADPLFAKYFLNIIGDIHYILPGVFDQNPEFNLVNSQLWTVPLELECYLALAVLAVLGITRYRSLMLSAIVAAQVIIGVLPLFRSRGDFSISLPDSTVGGHVPVLCFLFGVLFYYYRDKIVWSGWVAVACAALCGLLLTTLGGSRFVAIPAVYLTVYLGVQNPRRWSVLESGDYSYGIYLFSMPLLQTIVHLGPWAQNWWTVLLIGTPLTLLFAAGSWHLVEKHALRLRAGLFAAEKRFVAMRSRLEPVVQPLRAVLMRPAVSRVMAASALRFRRPPLD